METTWGRAMTLAFAWQIAFVPVLMWVVWDSPTTFTRILGFLVFLGVPVTAGIVHGSKRVMIAAMFMPAFLFAGMFFIFMVIMGSGR